MLQLICPVRTLILAPIDEQYGSGGKLGNESHRPVLPEGMGRIEQRHAPGKILPDHKGCICKRSPTLRFPVGQPTSSQVAPRHRIAFTGATGLIAYCDKTIPGAQPPFPNEADVRVGVCTSHNIFPWTVIDTFFLPRPTGEIRKLCERRKRIHPSPGGPAYGIVASSLEFSIVTIRRVTKSDSPARG